jgi:hypothetical protein
VRTKVTLVLVFLNVALFFFIFKFERQWMTGARARDARSRILGPEAADIRSLEIKSTVAGATTISLARRGDTWWLTQPLEWPANPHAVSSIIHELQLLENVSSFSTKDLASNSMTLADYGLDRPKLTVTFASGEAPPTTLRIGDSTNIGNRLYVLSPDGERIHVVARSLADSLSLGLDKLRADSLLTIPAYEARGLLVQSSAVRLRIRRENNRWLFDTIINNARASKTAIDDTIGQLNDLRVKSFNPTPPPATLPSVDPKLRVTLEGNNRRETLLLGDPVSAPSKTGPTPRPAVDASTSIEYYAQLEGRAAVFTVTVPTQPSDLIDTLRNAQVKLREKRLLEFDARNVTAIALTAPNQPPVNLQRLEAGATSTEASWQLVSRGDPAAGPQTLPADRAVVQRLLEQLALLAAKETGGFVSDAPGNADLEKWGFNRPEREITLTLATAAPTPNAPANAPGGTTQTLTLQLGTDSQGALFARLDPLTNSKGSIYGVALDLGRELPISPRDWRDRQLPALPPTATITALTLVSTAADAAPLFNHKLATTETWTSVLASETAEKREALERVLAQLRAPRAKRFVQDHFTDRVTVAGDDRPWSWKLEATILLPGGTTGEQTSTKTLLFTERVGGAEQLAGSKESDAVFEIEQPLLDALWKLTYGPRDPGAPVEPKK